MRQDITELKWNDQGLLPAIAQDAKTGEVLMLAWMNPESLSLTLDEGIAVYWSRSRKKLWRKGETSGHTQLVREVRIDCDKDSILLKVEQSGGIACHTGRRSCFYM
ncbi:MAG: phosphoribosyl-AMP cyclohydrolase, partial [Pseudomonadales bacterium]